MITLTISIGMLFKILETNMLLMTSYGCFKILYIAT